MGYRIVRRLGRGRACEAKRRAKPNISNPLCNTPLSPWLRGACSNPWCWVSVALFPAWARPALERPLPNLRFMMLCAFHDDSTSHIVGTRPLGRAAYANQLPQLRARHRRGDGRAAGDRGRQRLGQHKPARSAVAAVAGTGFCAARHSPTFPAPAAMAFPVAAHVHTLNGAADIGTVSAAKRCSAPLPSTGRGREIR